MSDPARVHPLCARLSLVAVGGNLPVIDLQPLRSGDPNARRQVALQLAAACHRSGFCYLANHGLAAGLIERTLIQARRFFDLPAARKQTIAIEHSACHRGYFGLGGENLDPVRQLDAGDYKEGLKIGRELAPDHPLVAAGTPLHGPNQWPADLPGWRAAMQAYYAACRDLGRQLMGAFALALALPEAYFDGWLRGPMATLAPLHYPPLPPAAERLSAGAHTDFGCLTLLAQDDVAGLQIRDRDGRWRPVPPRPGTLVLNVGDMLARWSNDLFASTAHRVVNRSGRDRYSLAFFYDPEFATPVACLPHCSGPDFPPRYPATTCGCYLLDRIADTFAYRRSRQAVPS